MIVAFGNQGRERGEYVFRLGSGNQIQKEREEEARTKSIGPIEWTDNVKKKGDPRKGIWGKKKKLLDHTIVEPHLFVRSVLQLNSLLCK